MSDEQKLIGDGGDEPNITSSETVSLVSSHLAEDEASHLVLGTIAAHEALVYRARGLEALRKFTIQQLKPEDFHYFGKNVWLMASGVTKIIEIYGIHFDPPTYEQVWRDRYDEEKDEVIKNSHYIYRCTLTAHFWRDKRAVTVTGSASTRDPLLKIKTVNGVDIFPHPLNVNEDNIRKKAETNARARALIALGVANFTPAELQKVGLEMSKATKHTFKSKAPVSLPTSEQWEKLKSLMVEKVIGVGKDHKVHEWFPEQGLSQKNVETIISYLSKAEGEIPYDDFKTYYDSNFTKGGK